MQFPVDRLKIDRTFVRSVHLGPQEGAIAAAVIAMADSMHLRVTAEGVETRAQLEFLEARRCDEVQGFYLCKPLPATEAAQFLRTVQCTEAKKPGSCAGQ